jgi:sugar lactone lactonase YvrE
VGEAHAGLRGRLLPDGGSRQLADEVWFPNGIVVLGEDTLVVAESHADRLTAWTITDSAELVDRRVGVMSTIGPRVRLWRGSSPHDRRWCQGVLQA